MRDNKIALLKTELEKTLLKLPDGVQFQMIFFAGPAWTPGGKVMGGKKKGVHVEFKGKQYRWKDQGGNNWIQDGAKQKVTWERSTTKLRESYAKLVRETPLTGGTTWDPPLEMAISMDPAPDLIVFLTDGTNGTPENSMNSAEKIGKLAKSKGIKINTTALLEPRAKDAMAKLAHLTGGEFALIGADGQKVNADGAAPAGIKKRKK